MSDSIFLPCSVCGIPPSVVSLDFAEPDFLDDLYPSYWEVTASCPVCSYSFPRMGLFYSDTHSDCVSSWNAFQLRLARWKADHGSSL